ncbi:MAG: holo-ACP synthase [Desulfitobacteriaceae bacterium]
MYPGVDILEIDRFEQASTRRPRLLERLFTVREREELQGRGIQSWAGRFAAKEAVLKAFGTGLKGLSWQDIEILTNKEGEPVVQLSLRAQGKLEERGGSRIRVSLSHDRTHTVAMAILS